MFNTSDLNVAKKVTDVWHEMWYKRHLCLFIKKSLSEANELKMRLLFAAMLVTSFRCIHKISILKLSVKRVPTS